MSPLKKETFFKQEEKPKLTASLCMLKLSLWKWIPFQDKVVTCHLLSLILCPFVVACDGNAALSVVQPFMENPEEWRRCAKTHRKLFWQTHVSEPFISEYPDSLLKKVSFSSITSLSAPSARLSSPLLHTVPFRVVSLMLLSRWNFFLGGV